MRIIILLFILTILQFSCSNPSESQSDKIPPIIKITYPPNDTTVSGVVDIQCEASDDGGIKNVELLIDSVNVNIFDDDSPYILKWDTQNYKNGSHKIYATAYDNNGNSATSDTLNLKVDNANTHSVNPAEIISVLVSKTKMTITWTKSDITDFASYELYHSESGPETKELIVAKNSIDDTSHILTEFNPIIENWFWVNVIDTLGYSSISNGFLFIHMLPESVNIKNVDYNRTQMTVTWFKSDINNFDSYELFWSDSEYGSKSLLSIKNTIAETQHILTEFDPNIENWFWVNIVDTLGYSTLSTEYMFINLPPDSSKIFPILFENNTFSIEWSKNKNKDYYAYELYESFNPQMESSTLLYRTENQTDTTFMVQSIPFDENRFYQIKTIDFGDLAANSSARIASSYIRIVFRKEIEGNTDIYIKDVNGSDNIRLTYNSGFDVLPEFSPDGSLIIYQSERNGNSDIYTMNIIGKNKKQLTTNGARDMQPKFSNDGSKILFLSNRDGNREIYIMDQDGSDKIRLTNNDGVDEFHEFSNDDSKIVYLSERENFQRDLFLLDLNTMNETQLTNNDLQEVYVKYSPTDEKVTYVYDQVEPFILSDIYILDIKSQIAQNLTNAPSDQMNLMPLFTHEGENLIYISNSEIYMMDNLGNNKINISQGLIGNEYIDISSDSRYIVTLSWGDGKPDIFARDFSNPQWIRITDDSQPELNIKFQKGR